jgi:nitrogen fixation protein NifZ
MTLENLEPGDMVFAAIEIRNDGSVPDLPAEALLAQPGTRGVLLNTGHLEEQPNTTLYLVRFEDENRELGPPVGCWPEEIVAEEPVVQ